MGKASIVYIVGLWVIMTIALMSINATNTSAIENFTTYYGRTMAHNIAVTGANIGTQKLLFDPSYSTDLLDQQYAGGSFDLHITKTGGDSAWVQSYAAYTAGGGTIRDTVIACLRFTSFGKYGWFTDVEKNGYVGCPYYGADDWKITGDSVFGYAHTNKQFHLGGAPYFNDKVTATTAPKLMAVNGVKAPVYRAGYQWGITVSRPASNMTRILNTAALGGVVFSNTDVALNFLDDKVAVKIPPATGTVRNDTVPIATLAPNGVIAVNNGDLRVKGRYQGKITVSSITGNIWLDGNGIAAHDDPTTHPESNDMLGIVANKSIYISKDLTRTSSSVFSIQAAVFSQLGELTAESFWSIPRSGRVNLFGGVTQATAGSLGVFNSGGLINGMYYTIRHDIRYNYSTPPVYPISDKYELASWWED